MKGLAALLFVAAFGLQGCETKDSEPKAGPLDAKIRRIQDGATRADVIQQLGPATWAMLKGDADPYAAVVNDPSNGIRFRLTWRNDPCMPVSVDFNAEDRAMGESYSGGICGKNATPPFAHGAALECTASDRAPLCGR